MRYDFLSLLITQTWQIAFLAVVVWIVVRLTARERPHLAHALWALVLIKCVTPPVWSSPTSPFSWITAEPVQSQPRETHSSTAIPEPIIQSPDLNPIVVHAVPEKELSESDADLFSSGKILASSPPAVTSEMKWSRAIALIWVMGAALVFLVTWIRFVAFLRWIRRSETLADSALDETVKRLTRQLGIKRNVRARALESPVGPAVLGLIRPTILLPASIVREKSSKELEPLVAHELIHIRRGDLWWALVQTMAKTLFWFHPLVRIAAQMVTRESERSCDEETIACLGCSPSVYAMGLLEVLEHKHRLRVAPALPGVRPVDITSARLERVMSLGKGIHRRTPFWVWLVVMAGGLLVLPGAALVLAQESATTAEPLPELYANPSTQGEVYFDSGWRAKSWDVSDILSELKDAGAPAGLSLTSLLPGRHPGVAGASTTPDCITAQISTENGIIELGNREPTMKVVDGKLHVLGTEKMHARVAESLAGFRKFGFRQILVETRFITTTREFLETAGVPWSVASATIGSNGNGPAASHLAAKQIESSNQGSASPPTYIFGTDLENASRMEAFSSESHAGGRSEIVNATSFVELNSPVLFSLLDDKQVVDVIQSTRGDVRSTVLQAPTITMFNGQSASIVDGTQRPFVVGLNRGPEDADGNSASQPVIRIISEGTTVNLNAIANEDELVNLDCQLTFSQVLNVDTVTFPTSNGEGPATLQIPQVATTRILSSLDVPDGKTLALSCIRENADQERVLFLALVTCRVIDSPDSFAHLPLDVENVVESSPIGKAPVHAQVAYHQSLVEASGQSAVKLTAASQPSKPCLTIRSEDQSETPGNYQALQELLGSMDMEAQIEGDVQFAVTEQGTRISGRNLSVRMDDELMIMGGKGEININADKEFAFGFSGDVEFKFGDATIRADHLTFQEDLLIRAEGSISMVMAEPEMKISSERLSIDLNQGVMLMNGNARLIRTHAKGEHSDIQADRIEWGPEPDQIKASNATDPVIDK